MIRLSCSRSNRFPDRPRVRGRGCESDRGARRIGANLRNCGVLRPACFDLQQFGPLPLLTDISPHSGGLMMDLGGAVGPPVFQVLVPMQLPPRDSRSLRTARGPTSSRARESLESGRLNSIPGGGRRGHAFTGGSARGASGAPGVKLKNCTNRRCRSRAYHGCRARSLVRRLLVASIVVISAVYAPASGEGCAEPPWATRSAVKVGPGGGTAPNPRSPTQ
jgi:hypothetical protein